MNDTNKSSNSDVYEDEAEKAFYSEILQHARERLYSSSSGWDFIVQRIKDDLEFSSGKQWDDATAKMRDGRPSLVLDKTKKFVDKVTGAYRNNPPGINVSPKRDASMATAEAYECYIRNVITQPASRAAIETAGEHAAICGYGWIHLNYDYESEKSFDLVPYLVRIDDPRAIRIDRASVEADGSDAMWGFRLLRMDISEAKEKYGEDVSAWDAIPQQYTDQWVDDQQIILAQYWWIDEVEDTLAKCLLVNGTSKTYFMSEIESDQSISMQIQSIINQRPAKRKVCNYAFLSGAGVIETREWPSCDIPLVPVYGRQTWQDDRQFYSGLIRPLMDAQRLINYYSSTIAEVTALSPRVPFIIAEGQDEGYESDWQLYTIKNLPTLKYRPVSLNGTAVPPPSRSSQVGDLSPLLQALTVTTQDLTDISGIYEASLGQDSNQKSGVAIREASKNSDQVVALFGDNLKRSVVRVSQMIVNMMPNIISEDQTLKLRHEDNSEFLIKHSKTSPQMEKKLGMDEEEIIDFTSGCFDISIESGSSYSTRRQETSAAMMELMNALPDIQRAAIAPEAVASQDWVGSERLAKILRLTLPPDLQASDDEEKEIDPQAKSLLDGMKNEITILNQETHEKDLKLTEMQDAIKQLTLAVENTQMSDATKERIADKKNYTDLLLKQMDVGSQEDIAAARELFKKNIEDDKRDHEAAKTRLDAAMKMADQFLDGHSMNRGEKSPNHAVIDTSLPRTDV